MIFNEIFLTKKEKDSLSKWEYKVVSNSILEKGLNPIYNFLALLIPYNVSPNALSLGGLIFTIFAWSQSDKSYYGNNYVVGISMLIYMVLDAIDGKHARNTLTSTPLGEIFDHFCDCISNILLSTAILNIFEVDDARIRWLFILSTNIVFLTEHVSAYTDPNKTIHFGMFNGPTEALVSSVLLLFFKPLIFEANNGSGSGVGELALKTVFPYVMIGYGAINFVMIIVKFIKFKSTCIESVKDLNIKVNGRHNYYGTLFGFSVCFICQAIKFFNDPNDLIQNGIIFSTLCADIIIAKMANRSLHQLIPVFHMISILSQYTGIPLAIIYFILVVYDISSHLKIPIINPIVNVFVSGYFDGCHHGHKLLFERASRYGTKLIVGVHSDADSLKYKNKRPMNDGVKRAYEVSMSPFVDQVISDCPLIVDEEMRKKYKIHCVGVSTEYMGEGNDPEGYYKYAVSQGMVVIIERTEGVSSTQLRSFNMEVCLDKLNKRLDDIEVKIDKIK